MNKRDRQKKLAEKRRLETKKREAILAAFLPPKKKFVVGMDLAGVKPTLVIFDELDRRLISQYLHAL